MGYRNLVAGNVKRAFNLLKDLVQTVTLTEATKTFDFSTQAVSSGTPTTRTAKGIKVEQKKARGDKEASAGIETVMLFQSADLANISRYATVTLADSTIWSITHPVKDDGYLITATITRTA